MGSAIGVLGEVEELVGDDEMVERLFDLAGTAVEVVRSDGFVADGTINGGEDVEKLVGEEFDMDGGWMQGTDLMIFDAQGDGLAVNDELWDSGWAGWPMIWQARVGWVAPYLLLTWTSRMVSGLSGSRVRTSWLATIEAKAGERSKALARMVPPRVP